MKNQFMKTFLTNYSLYEKIFLATAIAVQIVIFCITPDNPLNLVAGITGILSSVLCSKGKIEFFLIGLIQIIAYMILAWQTRFYGVFLENLFYLVTTTWCAIAWKKHLHTDENGTKTVKIKRATTIMWLVSIISVAITTVATGAILTKVGGAQPYADAAMIVMSVLAQFLMIYRYREQWVWWVVVDLLCIKMWLVAGNWSMVVMSTAWTINAIYGWRNWSKLNKEQNSIPSEAAKS